MEWVAVAVNIASDPRVHRMSTELRLRVPDVVGLLTLTFAEMTQHTPDGRVGEVPDTVLELWALWHGKRGRFAALFRSELCDETGLVTAWEKWNGAAIRRATAARERTRAWRDRREGASPNAPPAANGTHTRTGTDTHTETVPVCGTGQDQTVQDRTGPTENSTPTAGGRGPSPAEEQLKAQCGEHYPAVLAFLDERPSHLRAEWAKDLLGYIGPATGNLPEDLARAATDGKLADPPVTNARTLRIFLASCREERLAPARAAAAPSGNAPKSDPVANAAWQTVLAMIPKWHAREITAETFATMAPGMKAGIKAIGGFQTLVETKAEKRVWLKQDFVAAFRAAPKEPEVRSA